MEGYCSGLRRNRRTTISELSGESANMEIRCSNFELLGSSLFVVLLHWHHMRHQLIGLYTVSFERTLKLITRSRIVLGCKKSGAPGYLGSRAMDTPIRRRDFYASTAALRNANYPMDNW